MSDVPRWVKKPWSSKDWKARRLEFIKGKSCAWCGSDKVPFFVVCISDVWLSDEDYLSFKNSVVLCKRCAGARHFGFVLCIKCKNAYHKPEFSECGSCAVKSVGF